MNFVVTHIWRTTCDHFARYLDRTGHLRLYTCGTRRFTSGIATDKQKLLPGIGAMAYLSKKTLSQYQAESLRMRMHPLIDKWTKWQLKRGDHIFSSYGYANECFIWAKKNGGTTWIDAGNSHPESFWKIMETEHKRWGCELLPVARHHYERSLRMMDQTDYICSPSRFVSQSFLERGFEPRRILENIYPIDLANFTPRDRPREKSKPLTMIYTGSLSLRKGSPYLLEAFRIVLKSVPNAKLYLTQNTHESFLPILRMFSDLPVTWFPNFRHIKLAEHLRSADIFILPSLEDGFAMVVSEALSCGLPVITTPHTGASDLITSGQNGEVVPVRDAQATATAILKWWQKIEQGHVVNTETLTQRLSQAAFEETFEGQLEGIRSTM